MKFRLSQTRDKAFTALELRLAHYVQVASHCSCLLACFLPSLPSLW